MSAKIKTGLGSLTPVQLVTKAELIISNVDGNANFPTPDPTIAEVQAAVATCDEWIQKAAFRDQRAIARRTQAADALNEILRQMAAYVSFVAKGDGDIIRSSGFQTRKRAEPVGPISQPENLKAVRSDVNGEINLDWKAVANSRTYQVEMTTSDPALATASWSQIGLTSRSRFTVDNLERGTMYWFRVMAVGSTSKSAYSDVALVMAA